MKKTLICIILLTALLLSISIPALATNTSIPSQPLRTVINYRVINCNSVEDIEGQLSSMIKDGWQPYGSLLYVVDDAGWGTKRQYIQSVVKYAENLPHCTVVGYKVVNSKKTDDLAVELSRLIEDKWQPHGSLIYVVDDSGWSTKRLYIQAMIKFAE